MKLVGVHLKPFKAESGVSPILSEIAIHGVMLEITVSQHCGGELSKNK